MLSVTPSIPHFIVGLSLLSCVLDSWSRHVRERAARRFHDDISDQLQLIHHFFRHFHHFTSITSSPTQNHTNRHFLTHSDQLPTIACKWHKSTKLTRFPIFLTNVCPAVFLRKILPNALHPVTNTQSSTIQRKWLPNPIFNTGKHEDSDDYDQYSVKSNLHISNRFDDISTTLKKRHFVTNKHIPTNCQQIAQQTFLADSVDSNQFNTNQQILADSVKHNVKAYSDQINSLYITAHPMNIQQIEADSDDS